MRLIDADALLKELKKSCEYHAENSREFSLLQRDIIIVQEQPTIDAVPIRHGKWVFNPIDAFEAMFAKPKCSECGFESADGGNYCPNCGARMDEE